MTITGVQFLCPDGMSVMETGEVCLEDILYVTIVSRLLGYLPVWMESARTRLVRMSARING